MGAIVSEITRVPLVKERGGRNDYREKKGRSRYCCDSCTVSEKLEIAVITNEEIEKLQRGSGDL